MKRHIGDTFGEIIMILILITGVMVPENAFAEWSGDMYIGMHSSNADDTSIDFNGTTVFSISNSDTGSIIGGRIGYWSDRYPWLGVALDASFSQIDYNSIDIGVGSLSTLLMLRLILDSGEAFPNGRIQPYLGVGPGFFYGGTSEFITTVPSNGRVLDDTYFSSGFDARVGIFYAVKRSYGIMLEYGLRRFSPSMKTEYSDGTLSLEPTISTHIFIGGISFRF